MTRRIGSERLNILADKSIAASHAAGYPPVLFIRMRYELGTLGAIKKLITSGTIESGLDRLLELGLSEYTLEQIALKCPDEFTATELQCARWKLQIAEDERR